MPNSTYIYLVELTGYTDVSASAVYRFATRTYITSRADTPADTEYLPFVVDAGSISRQIYVAGDSGQQAQPRAQVGYGSIKIANKRGDLDALFGNGIVSFRERPVRVLRVATGAAYSTAVLVLSAVISQIELQEDVVVVGIKDALYNLDSPHVTTLYAGNNALPNGVEGASELAGKAKPVIYGKVFQIEPICVNTSRLIYQVSTRPIQSGTAYDGGVALSAGANYTSQSDMETNVPAAGTVRWWPAGGMYRAAAKPAYRHTADVVGDTAGASTAAQILKQMALDRGVALGDISATDVSALDALNSAVLGIFIDNQSSTLELMDQIASSVGAYYGYDRLGVLRMGRFDVPSGSAVAVVAQWNDSVLQSVAAGENFPTATVNIGYGKYYQPAAPSDLAGSVSAAVQADLRQAYRTSTASTTLSPNPYRRTQTLDRKTLLTAKSDADTEAARVLNLVKVPRRTHLAKSVALDDSTLFAFDINAVVELRWRRYGFDPVVGTLRRVLMVKMYLGDDRADLTLWGA